ncbi:hypothetical protein BGX26_009266, partial [Mortierella sp. AD094]
NSGLLNEEEDDAEQQSVTPYQQSLGSVSTLDLPSPALSAKDEEKSNKKMGKGSWVWRWAKKRTDAA